MMYGNWSWGQGMMSGFGFFGAVFGIIILIDLILLGVWLWKQIQK